MFTQDEISKRIQDQLYLLDPEISLEVGTPERKIIDIVAQSLSDVQFDKFVQDYQFDIDTKFGQDLDDFVQLFGFARQSARRASGFVILRRKVAAPAPIYIPAGTQVGTTGSVTSPQILFRTVVDGRIPENALYTEVPVECIVPGIIGNVTANKINRIYAKSIDYSSVNNTTSTSGGVEQETDDELKIRFKNNIFRNISGTDDQLLALAIANQYTNRATVIGPVSRFNEYLTIAGGSATSSNPNAKYVYDFNYYLSNKENDLTKFYNPEYDYTFDSISQGGKRYATIGTTNTSIKNPPPSGTPVAGTSTDSTYLQGSFLYGYTYVYSLGGESTISPASNIVSYSEQAGTVSNLQNSHGTSLAGGTVAYKRVYRKEANAASPIWEAVGTLGNTSSFYVTSVERSGGTVTAHINGTVDPTTDPNGFTSSFTNIVGGTAIGGSVVMTFSGTAGTAVAGTHQILEIGTTSFKYLQAGTAIGSVTVVGTAVMDKTGLYDELVVPIGEPPAGDLTNGKIVFLEHEYLSNWSRNVYDTANSYNNLNKVDIYISGQATDSATDVTEGPGNLIVSGDTASKYYYKNYVRNGLQTNPSPGNYFINLLWTPVRTIPSELNINDQTYELNTHYWLIKDISNLRDSYRAVDGIEIDQAMATAIANSVFTVDYTFDKLPYLTNKIIDSHRVVGQDVLVHTANFRRFIVNLSVVYSNGFVKDSVDTTITNNLNTYFNEQLFGAIVDFGDILKVVYQSAGVQSVEIATPEDDPTYYGIQEVDIDGDVIHTYVAEDGGIMLQEIDLPQLHSLGPDTKGTGAPIAPLQKVQTNWKT